MGPTIAEAFVSRGSSPGSQALVMKAHEDEAHCEPASSKDTFTRLNSPRNSKSSGTVIQRLKGGEKTPRDRQSEECTSSASDRCQQDSGQQTRHAEVRLGVNVNADRLKQEAQDTTSGSIEDLSKSSSSVQRKRCLGDAQSEEEVPSPKKKKALCEDDDTACRKDPVILSGARSLHVCPAEAPQSQKIKHKASKHKNAVHAKGGRNTSSPVGETFTARVLSCQAAEGSHLQDPQNPVTTASLHNDSLSRACSTMCSPVTSGSPRETDAAAPSEFPQFQRKQRSKMDKRGRQEFKHPGRLSNRSNDGDQPGSARLQLKPSSSLRNHLWGSDLRGVTAAGDDDYKPPGSLGDTVAQESRSQRLPRSRTQCLEEESQLYPAEQKSSGFGNRKSDQSQSIPGMLRNPSRSTRSQPQDISRLFECHYPPIQPAKKCRGFSLTAAVAKLEEISANQTARADISPKQACPVFAGGQDLKVKVEHSQDKQKAQRQSFADYLSCATRTRQFDRHETAKLFKGSRLGKILEATSDCQVRPDIRSENGISLSVESLTEASVKPHLDAWQQILRQSDDPSQSTLRIRQQADIERCWEDFYESQALEQSVLSDLHEWLQT